MRSTRSSVRFAPNNTESLGDIVEATWAGRQTPNPIALNRSQSSMSSMFYDKHRSNVNVCMMHPDSLRRVAWSGIGMTFLALDLFYLTMNCFGLVRSRWLDITDALYWMLDVIFCFRTGTHLNGEVNLNAMNAMRSYVKGWFAFDIVLLVYQWIMIGLESHAAGQAVFIRYTRLARIVKLLRLTKLRMMLSQVLQRVENIYVLWGLRLVLYTAGLTFYVHVSGAIWFTIGQSQQTGWVQQYDGIFKTWPLSYIGSFHWAVTQMQGSAEIMTGNLAERAASSVHYMMSIMVLAMVSSKLTTVMQAIADM